jgi:hypothetical protein
MSEEAWHTPHVRCLGVHFRGGLVDNDEYGEPIIGDHIVIMFNADHTMEIPFALPKLNGEDQWQCLLDTAEEEGPPPAKPATDKALEKKDIGPARAYQLQPCSMAVFTAPSKERKEAGAKGG